MRVSLFEESCICFCLRLQTVCLVSQARPFLFRSIASSICTQYTFSTNMEMESVWLAIITCLADKSNKVEVGKISVLKTMSETVQKTLKQQENVVISLQMDKTRTAFHLLLCKIFEDLRHGYKLIHKVQFSLTVAGLYQQKDHPSHKDN